MGREVRMVPPTWEHPKKENGGGFKPLRGRSYAKSAERFLKMANEQGLEAAIEEFGAAPSKEEYMPDFEPGTATHFMMYEDTSEGTPISPAFETPEQLARWLADTGASAFGDMTASYEGWLGTIKAGGAVSAILQNGKLTSGVEAQR